jgi:hypothetical protein
VGWALVSGPKRLAKRTWASSVDVGLAEHQRFVGVECGPDLGDGVVAEVGAEVQAADFGTDAGAELGEFEFGFGNNGHGGSLPFSADDEV